MILVLSCSRCISLFLVSVPSAVGFRTLLTFDSPLPGIKYSWALYTPLRETLHRPRNPQEISKVLLPWPGLRNTFERHARIGIQRRMQRSRCWTLLFSSGETGTFAFYYVFGGASVSPQLSRNCQRTLASLSVSRQSHSIESRRFASKKIRAEIDFFFVPSQKKMT